MEKFLAGIARFQNDVFPGNRHAYEQLAESQSPETLFIGCSDSRVLPNELLQARPGELFICRTAGNLVPSYGDALEGVGATIEYAVEVLKVRHIVVCGHSNCGAMKAMMAPEKVTHLKAVSRWMRHADRAAAVARELHGDVDDKCYLDRLIEENVVSQLDHLLTYPYVAAKARAGTLYVHGLVFDIPSGSFKMLDRTNYSWVSVQDAIARREAKVAIQV
jgi:carbonic anhydrase